MSHHLKKQIASLLASGESGKDIAAMLTVSPSYISQLKHDEEFLELLAAEEKTLEEAKKEDEPQDLEKSLEKRLLKMEHKTLSAIESGLAMAELPHQLKTLETLANRRDKIMERNARKNAPAFPASNALHVTLTLPNHVIPDEHQLTLNSRREIVGINKMSLAPMGLTEVEGLLLEDKTNEQSDKKDG